MVPIGEWKFWTESLESSPGKAADEYVSDELGAKITCLNWSRSGSPCGSMKLRSKRNIFSFNCLNIQFLKFCKIFCQPPYLYYTFTICKMYSPNVRRIFWILRSFQSRFKFFSSSNKIISVSIDNIEGHTSWIGFWLMTHIIWLILCFILWLQ